MQRKHKNSQKGTTRFSPPSNYHDLNIGLDDVKHLMMRDFIEMSAEGDVGPHLKITRVATRMPQAVEVLTGAGPGDGERKLPPTKGMPERGRYTTLEAQFIGQYGNIETDWLDTLNLNLHGNRVYHYTDGVVQWMLNTRLNIPTEELHFPFASLMLTTRSETMVRIFLGPSRQKSYRPGMSLALVVTHRHDPEDKELIVSISTNLVERGERIEWANAQMVMPYGITVGEAIRNYVRDPVHKQGPKRVDLPEQVALEGWFDNNGEIYYRTVLNCLSYVTTPNPSISEPYQPATFMAGGTRNKCVTQDVGRDLKPIEVQPSEIFNVLKKGQAGTGKKLAWRVLVAGHWRSFPGEAILGPLARRNWIQPFWRGDEKSPERNREYLVQREQGK